MNTYQLRSDFATYIPTADLVENVQGLYRALSKIMDIGAIECLKGIIARGGPDKMDDALLCLSAVEELIDECGTVAQCLEEDIENHTYVPTDLDIMPSGSSLIAPGMKNAFIIVDGHGRDFKCRNGQPVSKAMLGGVCQCDGCPYEKECFAGDNSVPRHGRIAPAGLTLTDKTQASDIIEFLDQWDPSSTDQLNSQMAFQNGDGQMLHKTLPADVFRADGVTKLGTAVIDFRSGIVCSFTSDQVLPRFDEPLILRTKTGEFQAVWEEGPCRRRTLRLVNAKG